MCNQVKQRQSKREAKRRDGGILHVHKISLNGFCRLLVLCNGTVYVCLLPLSDFLSLFLSHIRSLYVSFSLYLSLVRAFFVLLSLDMPTCIRLNAYGCECVYKMQPIRFFLTNTTSHKRTRTHIHPNTYSSYMHIHI